MQTIKVVPYNLNWPKMFKAEAKLIKQALGDNCLAVHHIGSTSVPGLSAKPLIDILPVVKSIVEVNKSIEAMAAIGYEAKGEYGICFRRYFQKGVEGSRTHHVHIFEEGSPEINRHLLFRDWLRTHPDDAKAYETLKLALAEQFPNDMNKYCAGKEKFITDIDGKDGFKGWRIVKAFTEKEWAAVLSLRQNSHSLNKADTYLVFYKNTNIVGYAHINLNLAQIVETNVVSQEYQQEFLNLCKKWLLYEMKDSK